MVDRDDKISLFTGRLPPEIRNEIYQYLLLAKSARLYADDSDYAEESLARRFGWVS